VSPPPASSSVVADVVVVVVVVVFVDDSDDDATDSSVVAVITVASTVVALVWMDDQNKKRWMNSTLNQYDTITVGDDVVQSCRLLVVVHHNTTASPYIDESQNTHIPVHIQPLSTLYAGQERQWLWDRPKRRTIGNRTLRGLLDLFTLAS
jgi:UDP-N-acetylmuramyl pentapeptide phosphotransferase/UDP-N-acetylglucosamine-1-phosphate transferase